MWTVDQLWQELSGIGISRPFSLTLAKSLAWYKAGWRVLPWTGVDGRTFALGLQGQVADESETQVEAAEHLSVTLEYPTTLWAIAISVE